MAAGRGGGGRGGGRGGQIGGRGQGRGPAAQEPEPVIDDQGWWLCRLCGDRRRDSWPRHLASHRYQTSQEEARHRRQQREREDYWRAHHSGPKPWNRH